MFLGHSFGLPVLAADVGSLKDDIVEGKTGFVFRPEDPADLARAIEQYFASDLYADLNSRRREIRDYATERHSWEVVGEMTRNVYAGLLGGERIMRPLVSILIPAYNAQEWIADTLQSAIAQTWQRKEIIVVDDGSTDRTLEIARRFESERVRVVTQKNQVPPQPGTSSSPYAKEITFRGWIPMISWLRTKSSGSLLRSGKATAGE